MCISTHTCIPHPTHSCVHVCTLYINVVIYSQHSQSEDMRCTHQSMLYGPQENSICYQLAKDYSVELWTQGAVLSLAIGRNPDTVTNILRTPVHVHLQNIMYM
jgi:hypothetical protein